MPLRISVDGALNQMNQRKKYYIILRTLGKITKGKEEKENKTRVYFRGILVIRLAVGAGGTISIFLFNSLCEPGTKLSRMIEISNGDPRYLTMHHMHRFYAYFDVKFYSTVHIHMQSYLRLSNI